MKLISKDAVIAEIEKWKEGWTNRLNNTKPANPDFFEGGIEMCNHFLSFINSMQEEPASEDLNKEIQAWQGYFGGTDGVKKELIKQIARHFANWQREKMIEQAAEGEVVKSKKGNFFAAIPISRQGYEWGEEVKGIILKKED